MNLKIMVRQMYLVDHIPIPVIATVLGLYESEVYSLLGLKPPIIHPPYETLGLEHAE